MAGVYSFSYGGTNFDWETASNWQPMDGAPSFTLFNGLTPPNDSFIFDDYGGGSYTALYSANGSADNVNNLTIGYSGATISAGPPFAQLNIFGSINVSAGVFDLGDGAEINHSGPAASTFTLDGILQGAGFIDANMPAITGTGTIIALSEASYNNLSILAPIADTITVEVGAGATIEFGVGVAAGTTVTMLDPTSGQVVVDSENNFGGTIAGLGINQANSYIDVTDPTAASATFSGNVITVWDGANGTGSMLGTINVDGAATGVTYGADTGTFGGLDIFLVCFAAGTRILTQDGNVAVETIAAGDHLTTVVNGRRIPQKVKWVGYRKLNLNLHPNGSDLAPIRIRRGAMADGLPERDLLVSPCHCMFMDAKLVPAKLLVNDMTITRETALTTVEYYHIELDRHALVIAEGLETESYLDTGNRAFFSNAGMALLLHPEFHVNAGLRCWATDACAPLVVSPAAVLPIWCPLADRAVALGYQPPAHATTTEAGVHLVADGRRIDTIAVKGSVHSFMVPAGITTLALGSRSIVPNLLARYLDDPRQIGVAVRGITIRGIAGRQDFAADHPALARGWHAPERQGDALWRWTTGLAALPVGSIEGPVVVEVTVSETTTYLIDDEQTESRVAA